MRLRSVLFTNYRSIQQGRLLVDPAATVLLGPNDAGKTNILRALQQIGERADFTEDDICKHSPYYLRRQLPDLTLEFGEFTAQDRAALPDAVPLPPPKQSLVLRRRGNDPTDWAVEIDDRALEPSAQPVAGIEASADDNQGPDEPDPQAGGVTEAEPPSPTPEPEQPPAVEEVPTREAAWVDDLMNVLPRIEFFDDFRALRSNFTVGQLESNDPEFEIERDLMRLGGIHQFGELRRPPYWRNQIIADAERSLQRVIAEQWSTDNRMGVDLSVDGESVTVSLTDMTTGVTTPDQHSRAILWYLSFLVTFLQRLEGEERPGIILLDEPGIRLHPRGQRDLLKLLGNLSGRQQVIYTAHHPYLIDKNYPGQVRVIEKRTDGTKINNKPYHVDAPSPYILQWEPLRTALGVSLGDSLLFDELNVVVEGVSDQIVLCAVSQELAQGSNPRHLDLNRTAVVPADGAMNVSKIVQMIQRIPDAKVVALLDADADGRREARRLLPLLPDGSALTMHDAWKKAPKSDRTLEDLLPRQMYLDAVNAVCERLFGERFTPIEADAVKDRTRPILQQIESFLPQKQERENSSGEHPDRTGGHAAKKVTKSASARKSRPREALPKVDIAREFVKLLRKRGVLGGKRKVASEFERIATLLERIDSRLGQTDG